MGRNIIDETTIIGEVRNNLKIINFNRRDDHGIYYNAECIICHKSKIVRRDNFLANKCSCDECRNRIHLKEDEDLIINGVKFLSYYTYPNEWGIEIDTHGRTHVICKCYCGTIFATYAQNYFSGVTQSCGCKRKEYSKTINNGKGDNFDDNRPRVKYNQIILTPDLTPKERRKRILANMSKKAKAEQEEKKKRIRPKLTCDDRCRVRKRNKGE